MAMLQELAPSRIQQSLDEAAQRRVPTTITVPSNPGWRNMHSRLLAVRAGKIYLEPPMCEDGSVPHEFVPGEHVGVSFKLKHYKHIFSASVTGTHNLQIGPDVCVSALTVAVPDKMQRLQRRAFNRAEVPPNRIVRGTFWLGGVSAEPAGGGGDDRPVWLGKVANISAGGLQMLVEANTVTAMEVGDVVGVRMAFGPGENVFADAQFRHAEETIKGVLIGLQFVGLTETDAGRHSLETLSTKVAEFQHISEAWRED